MAAATSLGRDVLSAVWQRAVFQSFSLVVPRLLPHCATSCWGLVIALLHGGAFGRVRLSMTFVNVACLSSPFMAGVPKNRRMCFQKGDRDAVLLCRSASTPVVVRAWLALLHVRTIVNCVNYALARRPSKGSPAEVMMCFAACSAACITEKDIDLKGHVDVSSISGTQTSPQQKKFRLPGPSSGPSTTFFVSTSLLGVSSVSQWKFARGSVPLFVPSNCLSQAQTQVVRSSTPPPLLRCRPRQSVLQ